MRHFDGQQYQAGVSNLALVVGTKYFDPRVLFVTHVRRLSGTAEYSAIQGKDETALGCGSDKDDFFCDEWKFDPVGVAKPTAVANIDTSAFERSFFQFAN